MCIMILMLILKYRSKFGGFATSVVRSNGLKEYVAHGRLTYSEIDAGCNSKFISIRVLRRICGGWSEVICVWMGKCQKQIGKISSIWWSQLIVKFFLLF